MRGTSGISRLVACAALAALLLGGCLGGGSAPPTHHYVLHTPKPPAEGPETGLHVGVATLEVDPPYDQGRLVYRASPGASEVGFYNYHRWAAPLGRLMASGLADGLAGAPRIASAEPTVSGADYDAVLFGRVIYAEEVDSDGRAEARIALALRLEGFEGEPLWKGTVKGSAAGPVSGGRAAMQLMQRAFTEVVEELRGEVSAAVAEPS